MKTITINRCELFKDIILNLMQKDLSDENPMKEFLQNCNFITFEDIIYPFDVTLVHIDFNKNIIRQSYKNCKLIQSNDIKINNNIFNDKIVVDNMILEYKTKKNFHTAIPGKQSGVIMIESKGITLGLISSMKEN